MSPLRPAAHAQGLVRGDVGREPVLQRGAGQRLVRLFGAQQRFGRVAGAAMRRPGDEIGAAIPRRRFRGIGGEGAGPEVEPVPYRQGGADIIGKAQPVGFDGAADRSDRLHIRPQRGDIAVAHPGIGGIGHRRIKPLAAGGDAVLHGAAEILLAPAADTGLAIRGDVGGGEFSERRAQHQAAGKRHAVRRGVAGLAVAQDRLIAALGDFRGLVGGRGHDKHRSQHRRQGNRPHACTSGPGARR